MIIEYDLPASLFEEVFCPPHIHGNSLVCVWFHFDDSSFKGSLRVRGQHTLLQQCYQKPTTLIFTLFGFWTWSTKGGHRAILKCSTTGFSSMSLAFLSQPIIVFANFSKMQHIIFIGECEFGNWPFQKGQMQENKHSLLECIFFVYALFLNEKNEILEIEI